MKEFFTTIEEHLTATILICYFIYIIVNMITENLKNKK